ncbi:MAG: hypothetical protein AB9897_00370 [Anaerolineaceae bacterium]
MSSDEVLLAPKYIGAPFGRNDKIGLAFLLSQGYNQSSITGAPGRVSGRAPTEKGSHWLRASRGNARRKPPDSLILNRLRSQYGKRLTPLPVERDHEKRKKL